MFLTLCSAHPPTVSFFIWIDFQDWCNIADGLNLPWTHLKTFQCHPDLKLNRIWLQWIDHWPLFITLCMMLKNLLFQLLLLCVSEINVFFKLIDYIMLLMFSFAQSCALHFIFMFWEKSRMKSSLVHSFQVCVFVCVCLYIFMCVCVCVNLFFLTFLAETIRIFWISPVRTLTFFGFVFLFTKI